MVDEIEMDKIIDDDADMNLERGYCANCGKPLEPSLSNSDDICNCYEEVMGNIKALENLDVEEYIKG